MNEDQSLSIMLGFGIFGIVLSGLLGYLNTNGILIDELVTTETPLWEVQAIIIILFIGVGIVLGWKK